MELQQQWWESPLAEDVYNTLCSLQKNLPRYYARSPQLGSRRCLVDWLATVCDNYHLCSTGRHLAITLLDYFMDRFVIDDDKLRLVALGCLLIATKFEEQEIRIPKATELNKYIYPPGYSMATYLKMELMILETFDWKISFPTAAHFVDYYMTEAITLNDLHCNQVITEVPKTRMYMEKYLNYFLEISLQDNCYREYKPSQVCAACIASCRRCLKVTPPWSAALQKLTQYTWQDLQPLVDSLLRTHQVDEKASQTRQCNVLMTQVSPTSNLSTGSPITPTATFGYAPTVAAGFGELQVAPNPQTFHVIQKRFGVMYF